MVRGGCAPPGAAAEVRGRARVEARPRRVVARRARHHLVERGAQVRPLGGAEGLLQGVLEDGRRIGDLARVAAGACSRAAAPEVDVELRQRRAPAHGELQHQGEEDHDHHEPAAGEQELRAEALAPRAPRRAPRRARLLPRPHPRWRGGGGRGGRGGFGGCSGRGGCGGCSGLGGVGCRG
ncbi:hypothetical protein DVJ78_05590 [Humibacter sp. BT305]|nr:hypothetical protein DVJ78_05590 [Humibacter sp. BT305]